MIPLGCTENMQKVAHALVKPDKPKGDHLYVIRLSYGLSDMPVYSCNELVLIEY